MSRQVNTVSFDIDGENRFCDGELFFSEGKVIKRMNGLVQREYELKDIDEVIVFIGVGCGCLEMKKKECDLDENIIICRFSMTCLKEISEFKKMLNSYLKTGKNYETVFDNGRCPKCGRPFLQNVKECLFCAKKGNLFTRASRMMKKYWGKIALIVLLLIVSSMLKIVKPVIQGDIIDKYLTNITPGSFSSSASGLFVSMITVIGLYLAGMAIGIVATMMAAKAGCSFSHELRVKLFDKIQRMSIGSVARHTTGELIQRVSRDTENVMNFFISDIGEFFEKTITFIVVLIILIFTDFRLTLLALIPVPIMIFLFAKTSDTIKKNNGMLWRTGAGENSVLNDIIRGIRVVKTFGNEENEVKRYYRIAKKFSDMSVINGRFFSLFSEPVAFIVTLGELLTMIAGGIMVLKGQLSLGSFVSFNLYLAYLYSPLKWFSGLPRRVSQATTSLAKVFDILDEEIDINNSEKSLKEITGGDINFENVTFGYKSYEPVLNDINLNIKKGQMIGLVGHSGAGKSTMINLAIRLYDPDEGKITLGGKDLRDFDQQSFRSKIGVVYQDTFLFSGTVYENIKYSVEGATPADVVRAAKIANVHNYVMNLPDGYDTVIGENGHRLSGGQRQRIAIARAVLKDPEILILDEATSALDPETEEQIQQALGRLVKGRTTIAIAHRLSTLRHADELVVIENGRIAEKGSHVELLKKRGIYYDLVMAQKQMTEKSSLHNSEQNEKQNHK